MESTAPASQSKKATSRHVAWCFLPHALFVLLALGVWGGGLWLLLPIVFLQVVLPALDWVTGWQDDGQYQKSDFSAGQLALLHWNTRLYAIFYMASVVWLAMHLERFNAMEIGMLVAAASLLGGIGFGAAHELLHGKEDLDQMVQRALTTFLFYPHYKLIHIRSHHVHAGTENDENTAWLNENIYTYILRTIPGSMIRCWQMEARRCSGNGLLKNQMFIYALGQAALLLGLFLLSGPNGLLFYLAHILGAHIVLESVNYIQHYGLMREKHDGEYEKTGAEHSWDTYHFFSSYVTYRVGHHSYHHIAVKPYYLLTPEPTAPKLPVGYFWAIAMVLLPPWWKSVINPKLKVAAAPGV
ncbi:fatty acid desaturase [Prosthecobacter sp.]|uniref:fatty acid desaturase n=1 Tax=Prosthecobacter sp. TaxID=1965333 RepID=UPI003784B95B